MAITLEQVEKLRERAQVSYEDARMALEAADGDMLEAVIYLERQGKIHGPQMGHYSTRTGGAQDGPWQGHCGPPNQEYGGHGGHRCKSGPVLSQHLGELWRKLVELFHKANANQFEIRHEGRCVVSLPVTLMIVSLIFFCWVTIPLLIIALFFGCSYRFRGPDLGKESINSMMDKASDTAENIKRSVMADGQAKEDAERNESGKADE